MTLNEITKGMSNAAEQINANFLTSSIIDSGTNENGSYVVFGNGLQICFSNKRIPVKYFNASTLRAEWILPKAFKDSNYVCLPNAYAFDGSTEAYNTDGYSTLINARAYGRTLSTSDTISCQPLAIGFF